MLSKRDNLLVRPWQQRRYQNHRRKVQSALPAIDSTAPQCRGHVTCKLKRSQSERERAAKIELDNLRLLQRMEAIMRQNRLDNRWRTPQPTFLNRVKLYDHTILQQQQSLSNVGDSHLMAVDGGRASCSSARKVKCIACNAAVLGTDQPPFASFDQRLLPWEEEHQRQQHTAGGAGSSGGTIRSHATVNKQAATQPSRLIKSKNNNKCDVSLPPSERQTPSIVLRRGNLHMSIHFPSDTSVVLKDTMNGSVVEQVIVKDLCECKSIVKLRK